jgi:L,D-transpeptidase-like protein
MSSFRRRNLFVAAFVGLLTVTANLPWARAASMHPPLANFAPTYSVRDAAARVAAAQTVQARQRQDATEGAIDANRLPLAPLVFFRQTGHHVSNRAGFLDFWRANGQVLIFGYPISEETVENGRVVQYFERARFEYHPELRGNVGQVQLGLLARELLVGSEQTEIPDPQNGSRYFPETQHTLSGEFRAYWERRGGLAIFGAPITEAIEQDGRLVQYFERTRFEYHPEDMASFYRAMEQSNGIALNTLHEVVLSDLGRRAALSHRINTAPVPQLTGSREWSPARWTRRIDVYLSTQWLTAYEDDLVVYRAPIATGRDGFNTPTGSFAIYDKLRLQTMIGADAVESWYVPDVPWVQYVVGGVALHGTYWHDQFGTGFRLSHGCINLGMDDAEWLYSWAEIGTTVEIHN